MERTVVSSLAAERRVEWQRGHEIRGGLDVLLRLRLLLNHQTAQERDQASWNELLHCGLRIDSRNPVGSCDFLRVDEVEVAEGSGVPSAFLPSQVFSYGGSAE